MEAISIRWKPHVGRNGTVYGLSHVHPFRFTLHFDEHADRPARTVAVHVGFSLHTFTCDLADAGPNPELYSDDRETRAFSLERYERSHRLKNIVSSLETRKCHFTDRSNYLTVDLAELPSGREYEVYFDVRRSGAGVVELVVQSAYPSCDDGPALSRRKVRFRVIVSEALLGKKPKPPP